MELARPLITRLPPGIFAHMMRQQLAQLARVDSDELDRQLAGPVKKPGTASLPASARPAGRYQASHKAQPFSPVRIALMHLLSQPQLAQLAGDSSRFRDFDLPGMNLLREVIETLQQNPHLGNSALLERWRGSDSGRHLEKLVMMTSPLDDEKAVQAEFEGAIHRLDQLRHEQRLDDLLTRSNQGALNSEEKTELLELFSLLRRD